MSERCLSEVLLKVKLKLELELNAQSRPPEGKKLSGAWTIPLGVAQVG